MAPPPPLPASHHVPALMDELLEEIFIRLPLDDPAILFHAALVCKSWRLLISGHSLRHRLHEFHGSPPLRGFFCRIGCRVLIKDEDAAGFLDGQIHLVVWNPIGGEVRRLPTSSVLTSQWNAALLCAAPCCDHLDCGYSGGHFQVVLAGTRESDKLTSVYVYSSEQHAWSKPISARFDGFQVKLGPNAIAIVGNTLYFLSDTMNKILEYDLDKQELSLIILPDPDNVMWERCVALMRAEGGGLGFTLSQNSKVYMWPREAANLDNGMPDGYNKDAVAENVGVIFVETCDGLFSIDLKSGLVTELLVSYYVIRDVVPYGSFCTPAFGSRAAIAGDQEPIANSLSAGKLI
ncbi:unnamed protein product [Urochloa decumbens]|uniref:F-box domain-containing protein n=1 Tax=Urochloa decumbens TaxID=240449 RepID=A0ABC9FL51_9POAL